MESSISRILYIVIIITILAFIGVTIWILNYNLWGYSINEKLEFYKFSLSIYETIGIGFLVAVLGIIIPHLLSEVKYKHERAKEARIAYSKAKTNIVYLPNDISKMEYSQAINHIKNVHQEKHLAEVYPENRCHREWKTKLYYKIATYRKILESDINSWDSQDWHERFKTLTDNFKKTLEKVKKEEREETKRN
jgi:hypothetical protein